MQNDEKEHDVNLREEISLWGQIHGEYYLIDECNLQYKFLFAKFGQQPRIRKPFDSYTYLFTSQVSHT